MSSVSRLHAGVGSDGLVDRGLAAASDDDLVALLVEGFGEAAADAGSAASDENGVAGRVHAIAPVCKLTDVWMR